MEEKVRKLLERMQEVEDLLGKPEVFSDQKQYRSLTQEHSYLAEVRDLWNQIQKTEKEIADSQEMAKQEKDPELLSFIKEELSSLENHLSQSHSRLHTLLVPPDPRDSRSIILEVRAGAGGDEAAIFVGDCVRMYKCYADKKGWKYESLSASPSERGGFKEYIMVLSGKDVFRYLQYEAGTHRVQRVPETEAQGRVHTSTVTVAILLEPEEEESVVLDEKDLRVETYRASGAGGQHVNVTDSAVRIIHIPTGTVVTCQEERSQHKNKDKAMRILSAKISEEKRRKEEEAQASLRSSQVGTGDRSERIRTYNFSQNRVTDHRIGLTLYKLHLVMDGDLEEITSALVSYFYQEKLNQKEL